MTKTLAVFYKSGSDKINKIMSKYETKPNENEQYMMSTLFKDSDIRPVTYFNMRKFFKKYSPVTNILNMSHKLIVDNLLDKNSDKLSHTVVDIFNLVNSSYFNLEDPDFKAWYTRQDVRETILKIYRSKISEEDINLVFNFVNYRDIVLNIKENLRNIYEININPNHTKRIKRIKDYVNYSVCDLNIDPFNCANSIQSRHPFIMVYEHQKSSRLVYGILLRMLLTIVEDNDLELVKNYDENIEKYSIELFSKQDLDYIGYNFNDLIYYYLDFLKITHNIFICNNTKYNYYDKSLIFITPWDMFSNYENDLRYCCKKQKKNILMKLLYYKEIDLKFDNSYIEYNSERDIKLVTYFNQPIDKYKELERISYINILTPVYIIRFEQDSNYVFMTGFNEKYDINIAHNLLYQVYDTIYNAIYNNINNNNFINLKKPVNNLDKNLDDYNKVIVCYSYYSETNIGSIYYEIIDINIDIKNDLEIVEYINNYLKISDNKCNKILGIINYNPLFIEMLNELDRYSKIIENMKIPTVCIEYAIKELFIYMIYLRNNTN